MDKRRSCRNAGDLRSTDTAATKRLGAPIEQRKKPPISDHGGKRRKNRDLERRIDGDKIKKIPAD